LVISGDQEGYKSIDEADRIAREIINGELSRRNEGNGPKNQ
jgi:hypothetical protein